MKVQLCLPYRDGKEPEPLDRGDIWLTMYANVFTAQLYRDCKDTREITEALNNNEYLKSLVSFSKAVANRAVYGLKQNLEEIK